MICSNCDYNNLSAPSDAAPCAFCGYRGHDTEPVIEPEPVAAIPAAIAAPATVAISEPVGDPLALGEPISL